MINISPTNLSLLIGNLESQVENNEMLKSQKRCKKLKTLDNCLKKSFEEISFYTRLLPKKEVDSLTVLERTSPSSPVNMERVKGHIWRPIACEVDELTGGYFYTFEVKDNCYNELELNTNKCFEVNLTIFPAIEMTPPSFKHLSNKSSHTNSKEIIKALANQKALSTLLCLEDLNSEEQRLLLDGRISKLCHEKIEKIKEKYPFLHEPIQKWLNDWKNPGSPPQFSSLCLFKDGFKKNFLEEYKQQQQNDQESLYFFESMSTWLFRNLGYRFSKNRDTNGKFSVRFPDIQSLSKRWQLCKNYIPNLPNIVFTDADGISSDELYVKKVTVEGDIVLSNGEEFFHDQSAHIIPLINSIGYSEMKCNEKYKKGKKILTSLFFNIYLKVETAKSVQLLSGEILHFNLQQKNYMRALASALVDGASSQPFIERKQSFSTIERSYLSLQGIIKNQNWQCYFKKRFDSDLVDSQGLFLEIFYQLIFNNKKE